MIISHIFASHKKRAHFLYNILFRALSVSSSIMYREKRDLLLVPTVEGLDSLAEEFITDSEEKDQELELELELELEKDQALCETIITRRKKTKEERAGPRKRRKQKKKKKGGSVLLDVGVQQPQHDVLIPSSPIADLKSPPLAPESLDLGASSMSTWNDWYQKIIKQSSSGDDHLNEELPTAHAEEEVDIKWWKTSYFLSKEYALSIYIQNIFEFRHNN
jgi:hypothetical protein